MHRLGYLPRLQDMPFAAVAHIRCCLHLVPNTSLDVGADALSPPRGHSRIPAGATVGIGRSLYRRGSGAHGSPGTDHPADLINVAIAELVRQRYELPAFSALDRLVRRVRARYTLLLCLVQRAQIQARDDLAEMFSKRIARFHA
jgi:hypothetical protein